MNLQLATVCDKGNDTRSMKCHLKEQCQAKLIYSLKNCLLIDPNIISEMFFVKRLISLVVVLQIWHQPCTAVLFSEH